MTSALEIVLTIIGLSFWILFPIGMFLSVNHIDKNTDQIQQLKQWRQSPSGNEQKKKEIVFKPVPFDWHHPIAYFKDWLQHE